MDQGEEKKESGGEIVVIVEWLPMIGRDREPDGPEKVADENDDVNRYHKSD